MKTCNKCKLEKFLDIEFYRDKNTKDGFKGQCKDCIGDRRRLRMGITRKRSDPFSIKEVASNRKKSANKSRSKRLFERYGLTQEGWDYLLLSQNSRCAVCSTIQPGKRGWQTDHNHSTGMVRGILCLTCNIIVGHVENGWPILVPAIEEYLKKHS